MPHSIINITTDIIFILLHFFLLLFSYYLLGKKYFQPAFLFSFTWLWILILHFIFRFTLLDKLEALHGNVYFIFFIGNLFFLLGSFLADSRFKNNLLKRTVTQQIQVSTNFKLRLILTVILLLGLPFYIQAAFKIFLASQAENFFSGLRSELVYGEANIGVLKYLVPLAYVVYAFNLYDYYIKKNNRNRVLVILTLLALFTYAVFATGRIPFLMILCIHLGVSLFANTNFSIKKYLALFGIFVIFFMVVGILSGKGGSTEDSFNENLRSSSEEIGIYMLASLSALDLEVSQQNNEPTNGENTLRFFFKLETQLGLKKNAKVKEVIQEFVFVPYATNVYTVYSPYIRDFGEMYAWIMLGIFGGLHTSLYNKSFYTKDRRSIFYYSFLLFPLLLSFFADQYLTLLSFWFQLIAITEMILFVNKFFNLKKW